MLSNAKAVLFDFDGVLMDTEWPIYQSWRSLFVREGHDLPIETYVQCIGSDFNTWSPQTYLEELTGNRYDWEIEYEARQVDIRKDLETAVAMPGSHELLSHLQEMGTPVSVVSSSTHDWVDNWLEKLGLMPFVQDTICRGDAPRIKPAPDLYLEAVNRQGVHASDCIVIEDSLNGTKAAIEAGCRTIAVPSRLTNCLDFSIAHHIVDELSDLLPARV